MGKWPSVEEMVADLPRWARVAVAGRCARRLLPIIARGSPQRDRYLTRLTDAIRFAEDTARNPRQAPRSRSDAAALKLARGVVYAAQHDRPVPLDDAIGEIDADLYAAGGSYWKKKQGEQNTAGIPYIEPDRADAEYLAGDEYLIEIFKVIYRLSNQKFGSSALYKISLEDLVLLHRLSKRERWNNDTPVPPEVFGPMWPEGAPEGWPALQDDGEQIFFKVELAVPQGMNEEESREFNTRVARFFAKLSAAHVSMGGTGLRLVEDSSCAPLSILDEEPVGASCESRGGVL